MSDLTSSLLSSTQHLLIACDLEGTVTVFNPASEQALGYSAAEVVGSHSPALWHVGDEVVARAHELSEQLEQTVVPGFAVFTTLPLRDGFETREWTFARKDGTTFPARLTVTCLREDESVVGFLGVIEDISARTDAQVELADAKAFLDLIIENIPDLLFTKDKEFRIVQANPAFLALYPEDKRSQVIGYTTLEEYDQEEAAAFLEKDREAFETGVSETMETIAFPDGKTRVLNTMKLRFESQGEPFILGIARDVTEREAMIRQLRESNAELQEFAYRTSHDLRSPLVSSIQLLGVAREAIQSGETALALESLSHMEHSLGALESLVRDILSLTQTQQAEEENESVDIDMVVDTALKKLSHLTDAPVAVERRIEVPSVIVKPSRFVLIAENMLSNAIKYQRPDVPLEIHVEARMDGADFVFSVQDNGLGIAKQHRPKLFQMFKRFHSRVSFGSGLGLYMMKKSAEAVQGRVTYEDVGQGSRFVFVLPQAKR